MSTTNPSYPLSVVHVGADPARNAGYADAPPRVGFFTDTSICIGCKACEVACKEWNEVPDDGLEWTGNSFDNTRGLGANTWRHVAFIEQPTHVEGVDGAVEGPSSSRRTSATAAGIACPPAPTASSISVKEDGRVFKCTLCYDRLDVGEEPACAKACPTNSIQFGELDELRERAADRVTHLHDSGVSQARLYGADPDDGVGGNGAFFLLLDEPEVYGLPPDPVVTTRDLPRTCHNVRIAAAGLLAGIAATFMGRRPS